MGDPVTSSPETSLRTTRYLALVLVILPFWQLAGADFDLSGTLVMVGLVLWLGRAELSKSWQGLWEQHRMICLMGAFWFATCVYASAQSLHTAASVVMMARWTLLISTALLAGNLAQNAPATFTRYAMGAIALSAMLGSLTVWFAWFNGHRVPFPFYYHARYLAYHTMLGAIASCVLLSTQRTNRETANWAVVGSVVWTGLLWAGGRGAILAVLGGLACLVVRSTKVRRQRLVVCSTAFLLVGLGGSFVLATPEANVGWWHAAERTVQATNVYALTSSRSDFWRSAWQHFLTSPAFGFGPDGYQFLTPRLDGQQPHNLFLQCLLDFGVVGTVPALSLLVWGWWRGWKRTTSWETDEHVQTWAAILTAGILLSLLDGPFYHLISFLPLAIAWGVCVRPEAPHGTQGTSVIFSRAQLGLASLAAGILALHGWLYYQVSTAPPPATPHSAVARIWRAFPSTTAGVSRWYAAWSTVQPEEALAWTRWTFTRTPNGSLFHVLAARLLLAEGRRDEARQELDVALATTHYLSREYIRSIIAEAFPEPVPPRVPSP